MDADTQTTVLVHPGSLFGSAEFTVGKKRARASREAIWREDIKTADTLFVVKGMLFDEQRYNLSEVVSFSIEAAPKRAALGRGAERITALANGPYLVTGAWLQHNGKGCVDTLIRALRREGKDAYASRLALQPGEERSHDLWERSKGRPKRRSVSG
jgi:hypothetical protein